MTENVLGISAFYHDSAAALIRDGEIVAAAQEERFSRRKHDDRFPRRAVAYCLAEGGITARDVDYAVFYEKPLTKFERLMETHAASAPRSFRAFRQALPIWATRKLHLPRVIRRELGPEFRGALLFTDHHESHAASAFYPSPFEEAAVLTLDAVGEWSTSSIGHGRGNQISLLREMRFPHSLGMLYSAFTHYTGFKVNSGEYKLMGLAPYGVPRYVDRIRDAVVDVRDDGSIWLDLSYFDYCHGLTMTSEKFHRLFDGPPRKSESTITQKEMDLAASIQAICEEVVLRASRHAHELTGARNLVLAGGVALNCVANGRVLRESVFDDVWVQPAAGDAGGALGAALAVCHGMGSPVRRIRADGMKGAYLGPAFSDQEIAATLARRGARWEELSEDGMAEKVAALLADGRIVGWFQGRMEFGP